MGEKFLVRDAIYSGVLPAGPRHGVTAIHSNATPQAPHPANWLDRAFAVREQLELALDATFASHPPAFPGASVVLYNEADAGLGDVAFAAKILNFLTSSFPEVAFCLVSTDPAKQRRFHAPDGVKLLSVPEFIDHEPRLTPTLVLSAPGNFDECRAAEPVLNALQLPIDTPFLFLAEYGSLRYVRDDVVRGRMALVDAAVEAALDDAADAHGVSPDEVGYRASSGDIVAMGPKGPQVLGNLVDALWRQAAPNPLTTWARLASLPARSCGLDAGELGLVLDASLTKRAHAARADAAARGFELGSIKHPELRRFIDESGPDVALYAGYVASARERFVDAVVLLEGARSRSIDVVLPCPQALGKLAEVWGDAALQARLVAAGIGDVILVGFEDETLAGQASAPGERRIRIAPGLKQLRIASFFPIPYRDMQHLLVASEPATCVSGDQSFSDAVSADQAIVFMEPVYCQAYHLDAVERLAGEVAPEMQAVLRAGGRALWPSDGFGEVGAFLKGADSLRPFFEFNSHVRTHYDAQHALMAVVRRHLAMATDPQVRDALAACVRAYLGASPITHGVDVGDHVLHAALS